MKTPTFPMFKRLAAALCLCLGLIHTAPGSTRSWLNASDGTFTNTANWSSSAVPGSNDLAFFNTANYADGSEFTVTLTGSPITNQNFRLTGANGTTLNFDLNGGSYTTTLTALGDSRVGDGAGVVVLNLYGGGSFNAGNLNIGQNNVSDGTINVSGATTALNMSAASYIGSAGKGTLNVTSGGTYSSTAAITVANGATSQGNVKVSGANSKFNLSTGVGLVVGSSGVASLVVENGGGLTNSGANSTAVIRFSTLTGSTSTALITGTNSKLEGGNIDIGGNASAAGGSADITVADGGDFKARGAIQLWDTSKILIDGGKVSSGGNFTAKSGSQIGMVLSTTNAVPLIDVGNDLILSGGDITLSLTLGSSPSFKTNDTLRLFGYGGALSGTFSNYTEGQIFQLGDYDFQFGYAMTSGADTFIGLTVVLRSLYWTADGNSLGGAGTWNTSGANWSTNEISVSGTAWNDTKRAVFTNSAATVTVDEVMAKKGILFATTGYTLEDGTITLGGTDIDENTITADSNVTATINSVLDGVNGFTKAGAGTLVLGGDNTFSGGAAISAGTLELKTDTGSALGNATSLTVGTSATLLLSKSGQVNNAAAVTLSGGTIERANGVSETFGNLNLTEASFLDYGTGDTGTLTFGTYTPSSLLTVNNFLEGNVLVFSSNLSATINNESLFSFSNGFTTHWNGSTFTITAIPEPSAYVVAVGLIGLMLWRRTKRA